VPNGKSMEVQFEVVVVQVHFCLYRRVAQVILSGRFKLHYTRPPCCFQSELPPTDLPTTATEASATSFEWNPANNENDQGNVKRVSTLLLQIDMQSLID
jgi:hypothetical protein